ncbi:unnamed protein product [Clonostachys rhizophaga]|uniref:Ornithine cyclodeaminase n=1 Tax=Clonostachys rhizophaga TaxID=160324 RepID=A0A9N9YRA4_9HYPO|nr:unnamed protein product [Clonostachys rhizophaga]
MQEIDFDTVTRASCIFTEHVDGLWAAAGDIVQPFNKVSGRKSQDEITLYESVGSAVLDLALAVEAYRSVVNSTRSNI